MILVVDDEPAIIRLVRATLQANGHAVVTAARGEEALQMLEEERPDLVVLDLMMPGMDGVGVLHRIRRLPDGGGLPVVVLSGDVLESRIDELKSLGVSEFLTKPVNLDELLAVLSRLSAHDLG